MIMLEKAGKKPRGSQFRGKRTRGSQQMRQLLYIPRDAQTTRLAEWPPSIFSRCGFLQNPIVDSFQPQNRCLALLPFKKELLLSILQCLGYLKLLLP